MGIIDKKLFVNNNSSSNRLCSTRLCIDICENIHIHHRDLRLEFSIPEWNNFSELIRLSDIEVNNQISNGYKENESDDLRKQLKIDINNRPDYFPNRIQIELQKNGTIHLHYFDIRLEFSEEDFIDFCKSINKSKRVLIYTRIKKILVKRMGSIFGRNT